MSQTVGGNTITVPPTDRSTGITWAGQAVDQTAAGSGTATQSWGFEFPDPGSTTPEIQCTWIVPEEYDNQGSTPSVTLMGWSLSDNLCFLDGGGTRYSKWSVSSRPYAANEQANANWPTAAEGSWSFACENNACGSGVHCRLAYKVKSIAINATSGSGNWAAGDLVFFRIRRVTTTDNLAQTVHLARVRLHYSRDN